MQREAKRDVGIEQIEVFERFGEHEGRHFADHFPRNDVFNGGPSALRA